MERGSAKHGPVKDDELQREVAGLTQGNPPVRGWPDPDTAPEAPSDDDPDIGAEQGAGPVG
jgi:hypothetical protein